MADEHHVVDVVKQCVAASEKSNGSADIAKALFDDMLDELRKKSKDDYFSDPSASGDQHFTYNIVWMKRNIYKINHNNDNNNKVFRLPSVVNLKPEALCNMRSSYMRSSVWHALSRHIRQLRQKVYLHNTISAVFHFLCEIALGKQPRVHYNINMGRCKVQVQILSLFWFFFLYK